MKVSKKLTYPKKTGVKRDDTAAVVAHIHGVSADYVRKVRNGDRDNEEIMATLVDLQQGKSALIQHLKKLIPITPKPEKYGKNKTNK